MSILRRRLTFSGWVQGVGFRWRAVQAASAVGATGWVRNDPSGTVTMELQGTEAQINQVIRAIERGAWIRIENMTAETIPVRADERGFYAD